MAKFDEQLSRMSYLMEYKMPKNEVKSNIEYHANGADGKVYGILKEGSKYYIKTTEMGKENLAESYDYINGINNRKENEFKSYNDATKHLELTLMSLNEAYGKHEDVTTVDVNRSEKAFGMLTEAARTELDRMKQIFENSDSKVIGSGVYKGEDKESKGKATDPKAQGAPFGEGSAEGSHENGTSKTQSDASKANKDYTDASKSVESKMTSTKMPKGGSAKNDYKDAHDDLDGEGVADKKPSGGKAVMVNEGEIGKTLGTVAGDAIAGPVGGMIGGMAGDKLGDAISGDENEEYDPEDDFQTDDLGSGDMNHNEDTMDLSSFVDEPEEEGEAPEGPMGDDMELLYDPEEDTDGEEVGFGDNEDYDDMSLDEMVERFDSVISGDDKSMTGPGTSNKKNAIATWERVGKDHGVVSEDETQEAKDGGTAIMDGEPNTANGQGGHQKAIATWERIEESIKREAKRIMRECSTQNSETLNEMVDRLVKEEVTRLNAWGKHPRYRKQPMTTPPNKEVLAGTADRDWNDDSAKGEQPYGQRIGDGAPFNQTVEFLTDGVMTQLKESLGLKKK